RAIAAPSDHKNRVRRRKRPKTLDRVCLPAPALVFPQSSLAAVPDLTTETHGLALARLPPLQPRGLHKGSTVRCQRWRHQCRGFGFRSAGPAEHESPTWTYRVLSATRTLAGSGGRPA